MKAVTTNLSKMLVQYTPHLIKYYWPSDSEPIYLNELIGQKIELSFEGQINCIICGKRTKKTYSNGACYTCFINAPQASPCIINPELCEAHLGKGRDVAWEQKHHNQPHIVYLAKASAIKVGVTRATQVPVRWIDQGATEAIILAEVPYRRLAGELEVQLKEHFTDKTNWHRMLKNEISPLDLLDVKEDILNYYLEDDYHEYISDDDSVITLNYPVENYPKKIKSIRLDKVPIIENTLKGIKGQYLYFDNGVVFNVRNHSGYLTTLRYE